MTNTIGNVKDDKYYIGYIRVENAFFVFRTVRESYGSRYQQNYGQNQLPIHIADDFRFEEQPVKKVENGKRSPYETENHRRKT